MLITAVLPMVSNIAGISMEEEEEDGGTHHSIGHHTRTGAKSPTTLQLYMYAACTKIKCAKVYYLYAKSFCSECVRLPAQNAQVCENTDFNHWEHDESLLIVLTNDMVWFASFSSLDSWGA